VRPTGSVWSEAFASIAMHAEPAIGLMVPTRYTFWGEDRNKVSSARHATCVFLDTWHRKWITQPSVGSGWGTREWRSPARIPADRTSLGSGARGRGVREDRTGERRRVMGTRAGQGRVQQRGEPARFLGFCFWGAAAGRRLHEAVGETRPLRRRCIPIDPSVGSTVVTREAKSRWRGREGNTSTDSSPHLRCETYIHDAGLGGREAWSAGGGRGGARRATCSQTRPPGAGWLQTGGSQLVTHTKGEGMARTIR